MRDVLACIDATSGELLWKVDFVEDHGAALPDFGMVCSPLVTEEAVYVQAGDSFFKLDKFTGEEIWRTLEGEGGMMTGGAFSSPVIADFSFGSQAIVATRSAMAGIDPESGRVRWTTPIRTFRGMNILTPVVLEDAVFSSAYGGRSQRFEIRADDTGSMVAEATWNDAAQGYMTSPVVVAGHAYYFLRSNRFACQRLSDGEVCWTSPPTGDEYWSLIVQDDRILALADTGKLYLLEATPDEFRILGQATVSEEPTWAHLAMVGNELFLRELTGLRALRWSPAGS